MGQRTRGPRKMPFSMKLLRTSGNHSRLDKYHALSRSIWL
jgi:hypothetical protein